MDILQSNQSPEILNLQPGNNGNNQIIPQKSVNTFAKKLADLLKETPLETKEQNALSILDQGSKGNQRLYCKKTDQSTILFVQFQQESDYYRQKALIQALCKEENQAKGLVPKYPVLKTFSEEKLILEMDLGYISLQKLKEIRQKKGYVWHDKEIQYLMKQVSKIIFQLYNIGVYHGNISPSNIFLRKNVLGVFEPVLVDFMDATNNFQKVNNFNPDYWSFQNEEYQIFNTKEDRLKQELYMVGRMVQYLMLDLDSKHELNLFDNQTNVGIQRCLTYLQQQKLQQYSQKTIDCLSILLKKGNIQVLVKKFKKFNKDQMLIDSEKYAENVFNHMCITHPPIEYIKKVKQHVNNNSINNYIINKDQCNNNRLQDSFISTQESENQSEDENEQKTLSFMQQYKAKKNMVQYINQEYQLQMALVRMKQMQVQKQQELQQSSMKQSKKSKKNSIDSNSSMTQLKKKESANSHNNNQTTLQQQIEVVQEKQESNEQQQQKKNKEIQNQQLQQLKELNDSDSEWDFIEGLAHHSDLDDSFEEI
ncbi:Protein kinase-like domain [Pseudocohnilembus persalinus]|uniref:Protein kinase-like domain n=1 Tax=Pseudocohnilembus persalinus TaxID=266149 RepID=A0A0V0QNC0_PSEPJ|nr:Protein kinase-like domain [Pseudocohnilembus persalinus]|eukprot:KRX03445.1 Protein kinase-like domain [Pseudocohnilembus persalinus]